MGYNDSELLKLAAKSHAIVHKALSAKVEELCDLENWEEALELLNIAEASSIYLSLVGSRLKSGQNKLLNNQDS